MNGKTLEELEGEDWGKPEFKSNLVITTHRLRKKPIDEFTNEDLRIMLGQGFGLPYLLPLALKVLEKNPLADGDLYEGDLLQNTLIHAHPDLLDEDKNLANRFRAMALKALPLVKEMDPDEIREELINAVERAINNLTA